MMFYSLHFYIQYAAMLLNQLLIWIKLRKNKLHIVKLSLNV